MPTASSQQKTPRQSIEAECKRRGKAAFVAGCIDLLASGKADAELIFALGQGPARWAVEGGEPGPDYWLRVWATRGLLWIWDDEALPSVIAALRDDAWRVREMAVKVVARHHLQAALPVVVDLRMDQNSRVTKAAERAVIRLTDCST